MYSSDFDPVRVLIAIVVLALVILSQRYWFVRAWALAERVREMALRRTIKALFVAACVLVVLTVISGLALGIRVAWHHALVGALAGLWISSALFAYLAVQFVAGIGWFGGRLRRPGIETRGGDSHSAEKPSAANATEYEAAINVPRRRFLKASTTIAGSIPFAGALYGFAFERLHFQIREVDLPIAGLPAALDGMHIVQLSDVHIGSYMAASDVRRAVDMANGLRGDLAVVTGDFITGAGDPLETCVAELSRLRAPLGVWGCNGNHEIYANAEYQAAQLFGRYGMRLLRQQNAELMWQGQAFNLIGVDYQRQNRRPMLREIEPLVRHDVPNILLSHNPNSFPRAAQLGIELSLAGHTHGGQVRVEILDHRFSPARFLTPYVAGLYTRPMGSIPILDDAAAAANLSPQSTGRGSSVIYVNRGLGTIGAPVRIGVPPEISLLTLRRA